MYVVCMCVFGLPQQVLSKQGDNVVLELEDGIKATANSSTAGMYAFFG